MNAGGTWTILVVEEQAKIRALLTQCLERDYRVLNARSVAEARTMLLGEEVDMVLCRQRPPDASAVELLREARISHPEAIRILITATTSHADLIRSSPARTTAFSTCWKPANA